MTSRWPQTGEVHIRLIKLAVSEADLSRLECLLAPDERARADRLIARQVRNRFVAGRGLLRRILGSYLGVEPDRLFLETNQYGKPFLPERPGGQQLNFNLSHSADLAILALAEDCEVGIDLEQMRGDLPFQAMARQFFSRREQRDLFSLPAGQQPAAFYRCWTRKEAYLKGCGSGFSQSADFCDVSLLPCRPPELLADRTNPDQPARWSLIDLEVPPGFCAALAVRNRHPVTHVFPSQENAYPCSCNALKM